MPTPSSLEMASSKNPRASNFPMTQRAVSKVGTGHPRRWIREAALPQISTAQSPVTNLLSLYQTESPRPKKVEINEKAMAKSKKLRCDRCFFSGFLCTQVPTSRFLHVILGSSPGTGLRGACVLLQAAARAWRSGLGQHGAIRRRQEGSIAAFQAIAKILPKC